MCRFLLPMALSMAQHSCALSIAAIAPKQSKTEHYFCYRVFSSAAVFSQLLMQLARVLRSRNFDLNQESVRHLGRGTDNKQSRQFSTDQGGGSGGPSPAAQPPRPDQDYEH